MNPRTIVNTAGGVILAGALLVLLNHALGIMRATECSRILLGYTNGTLVPVHEDARIEIGACYLQFNQPLMTEELE